MNELIIAPLLAKWEFLTVWLISPILLIGLYEIIHTFDKDKSSSNSILKNQFANNFFGFGSSVTTKVLTVLFLSFLSAYIFLIFYKEDFAWYDNFQFTSFSLKGEAWPMPIWGDLGRFWPLGLQEYNFLALLGKSNLIYRSFSVFQLLVLLFFVRKILVDLPTWYVLLTMTLVMITQSFITSFFELIYPERSILFWLAILLFFSHSYLRQEKDWSRFYLYGALIAAQFCLYYKETLFILISSFASAGLILSAFDSIRSGNRLFKKSNYISFIKENYLNLGLIVLSVVFITLYWFVVKVHVVSEYAHHRYSALFAFTSYIKQDFLLSIFLVVFVLRCLYLILTRKTPNSFWDSLALGAVMYFIAFIKLTMYSDYYLAPVDFVAALYLSQISYQFFASRELKELRVGRSIFLTMAVALIFLVINQNLQLSSFKILSRKNFVAGNVQLISAIKQYAESEKEEVATLFFPSTNFSPDIYPADLLIANFASFMEYKGISLYGGEEYPLYGKSSSSSALEEDTEETTFVLTATLNFENNKCVKFLPLKCFEASTPKVGDLIVLLPARSNKTIDLQPNSTVLLDYKHRENLSIVDKILLILSRHGYDFSELDVALYKL